MEKKNLVLSAVAGIIAVGAFAASANAMPEAPKNWEKCAGVAKKGMNDCAAKNGSHACAGQCKTDNDANEWVWTPEGTCKKIGGTVAATMPATGAGGGMMMDKKM